MARVKQDMPPPGGYDPIQFAKAMGKKSWGGYKTFAIFGAVTASGWIMYHFEKKWKRRTDLEMNDARIALQPFMDAERWRMFLRHCRRNRDEERELMKDYPGWEVGKIDGEPVFHNLANRFHSVCPEEFWMHNEYSDQYNRLYEKLDH